jgi:hypothetical protein
MIKPGSPEYNSDYVSTTNVIARFDEDGAITDSNGLVSQRWEDLGDGWKKVTYEAEVDGKMYFRLRGTNHPLDTPEELDKAGNPLPDFAGENTAEKAFSDLWFYSNPVFVETASIAK